MTLLTSILDIDASMSALQSRPGGLPVVGMRYFVRIADVWGLDIEQQLGLLGWPPRETFLAWRQDPSGAVVPDAVAQRIERIVWIYAALRILFSEPARAHQWIKRPNIAAGLGEASALDRMLRGELSDLEFVRRYLGGQLQM